MWTVLQIKKKVHAPLYKYCGPWTELFIILKLCTSVSIALLLPMEVEAQYFRNIPKQLFLEQITK